MAREPLRRSTKIIIGAVIAVLILLLVGAAGASAGPDVRYNYTVSISDTPPGVTWARPGGSEYVTVHITIMNDRAQSVSTNALNWQFKLVTPNGVEYNSSIYTFSHPSYELVNLGPGMFCHTVQVFELPKFVGHDFEVKLKYIGWVKVGYDPELVI